MFKKSDFHLPKYENFILESYSNFIIKFYLICTIFILIFSSKISYSFAESKYHSKILKVNAIEVEINLDKSLYLEGEMITLNIIFKNVSNDYISIENFNDNFVNTNILISTSEEKKLNYLGIISTYLGKTNYEFKPNEEISFSIDLLDNFGTIYTRYQVGGINGKLMSDKYTIKYIKHISDEVILKSNILTFNIVKPQGTDSIALFDLENIYATDVKLDFNKKAELYRDYFYKYLNSNYSDQAFKLMIFLKSATKNFNHQTIDDCILFINKKPNSIVTKEVIEGITFYLKTENENDKLRIILNQISKNYPNTKAAMFAQTKLDEN